LSGLLVFAAALACIPMPAMAAMLMVVAWQMSEADKIARLIRKSPASDVAVLLTCLSLTVFFDMVIAITAGVLLASVLFMKEIATLTQVVEISDNRDLLPGSPPANWRVFKVNGPLFFAAADRIFSELLQRTEGAVGIVLHMRYSAYLDAGGLAAIEKLLAHCERQGIALRFSDWQFQPLKTLARARDESRGPLDLSYPSLADAVYNPEASNGSHETG